MCVRVRAAMAFNVVFTAMCVYVHVYRKDPKVTDACRRLKEVSGTIARQTGSHS